MPRDFNSLSNNKKLSPNVVFNFNLDAMTSGENAERIVTSSLLSVEVSFKRNAAP